MRRVSQQCYSKPAPWVVAKRIKGQQLGYRAVQVLAYVHATIAAEGQPPSYRMIRDELGIATKGEVCRIVEGLERRGIFRRVGSGRVRRIQLAA